VATAEWRRGPCDLTRQTAGPVYDPRENTETLISARLLLPIWGRSLSQTSVEPPARPTTIGHREALSLGAKLRISSTVTEDALARSHNPVLMWTGGKDSNLALWLVRKVCEETQAPCPPLLFIDHGTHFDETWKLMDEVSKGWGLRTVIARNEDVLAHAKEPGGWIEIQDLSLENQGEIRRTGYAKPSFPYALGNIVGNHLLKTVAMNTAIREHRYDAVFTGIRWDEDEARSRERFISPRTDPPHVRVHPILHFSEREVWMETLRQGLPIHPLYQLGFRSIDGKYDSHKVADIPAWEQDLEGTFERAGRAQDKEQIMERLRDLGYM